MGKMWTAGMQTVQWV